MAQHPIKLTNLFGCLHPSHTGLLLILGSREVPLGGTASLCGSILICIQTISRCIGAILYLLGDALPGELPGLTVEAAARLDYGGLLSAWRCII